MLQKERNILVQAQMFLDAVLCMLALWMAHALRNLINVDFLPSPVEIESFDRFLWMLLLIPLLAPFVFHTQGYYVRELLPITRLRRYAALARGCLLLFIIMILVMFLMKFTLARSVLILFLLLMFTLVLLKDEALHLFRKSKMGKTQFQRRVIVAAPSSEARHIRKMLSTLGTVDFEVVGLYDLGQAKEETLLSMLHNQSANIVLVGSKYAQFSEVEKVIQCCELEGVDVWVMANFFRTQLCTTSIDTLQGSLLLVFRLRPISRCRPCQADVRLCRFFPAHSPALAAVAPDLPGDQVYFARPVFFSEAQGLNGIPFTMYKFRSMINNAEMKKHELERLNEMSGPVFKVTNDPRVTKIGALLRKTSLDELPQLFNVLKGEMSLVGPRPLPVDETLRFDDIAHRRRLSMRPGLTCLWQISGRNNVTDFNEWVRLDLQYIDNWSFWGDFKILLRTIPVVFRGVGAK